jgi:hypothetical protein
MLDALNGTTGLKTSLAAPKSASNVQSDEQPASTPLNDIEKRLADQVDIDPAFLANLKNLRNLEQRLYLYADVLKGKRSVSGALLELKIEKDYPEIAARLKEEGAKFSLPSARDFEATINATRERLFNTQKSILESLKG